MMYNNDYTTMDKKEIIQILEDIGMSPAEILVYISLLDGSQSVQQIMKVTNEKRPTIYYSLNSLEKRGLVSKTGKEYGNKFQIESIDNLLELVNRNIRKQNDLLEKTKKLKDFYPKNKTDDKVLVSHFDNLEAIKTAVFYSLYGKGKTIRTIVPANNFFHQMGKDFIEEYVNEKLKRDEVVPHWGDQKDRYYKPFNKVVGDLEKYFIPRLESIGYKVSMTFGSMSANEIYTHQISLTIDYSQI